MSITKVNADLLDLSDGYAFTGTVTGAGRVVQVVNVINSAVNTTTTLLPNDDTIPQSGEGAEFMTLAITPTNASNKLFIEAVVYISPSSSGPTIESALFQDSTAGALAAMAQRSDATSIGENICFNHYMTAGTVSATTFKIRCGILYTSDAATDLH